MSNDIAPMSEPPRRVSVRRCSFRFDGRPQSVKDARDWLGVRMNTAGVPEDQAHTAVLLLSELATNSLRHAATDDHGGAFSVRAFFLHQRLRVEVRDTGDAPFTVEALAPSPDAENGRGLLLVNLLADRWGRFESGRGPGMFFELRWGAPPSVTAALSLTTENAR